MKTCPRCNSEYDAHPAISRRCATTLIPICPKCGVEEALYDYMRAQEKTVPIELVRREIDFAQWLKIQNG